LGFEDYTIHAGVPGRWPSRDPMGKEAFVSPVFLDSPSKKMKTLVGPDNQVW
jgi:hypothetical protein